MKSEFKKGLSLLLCFLMLFSVFSTVGGYEHIHLESGHVHEEHEEHTSVLDIIDNTLGFVLSLFAVPVSADYEDGVECDYCGGWRYDDWKCENGDHCGEGADGDCYEEHHCGYCGACDDDHEMCDDCGNCLEDHCECDDKCRGCYEQGGTICSECGEHCTECDEWICDDCGKCADCAGNEAYCSYCDICINCAEWICYCGDGCSRCALGCDDCYEKCTNCEPELLCLYCSTCYDCIGGDGSFCTTCQLCENCVDAICYCGGGCSQCVLVCEDCGEKCENCADGGICGECGVCFDCVGGDGNYCYECDQCIDCVDAICGGCSSGCAECTELCPECNDKCMNCADDQICSDCGVCFDCVGGEGNYCAECGVCKNCVEICICGNGCVECAVICTECAEKCEACADDQLCTECGTCIDCVGGESNFCVECGLCYNCVDMVCVCGGGCSNCAIICSECGEKCEACADDQLCQDCEVCFDCVGGEGNYCAECGLCKNCVEICICGNGCVECATVCPECAEKCTNCAEEEICGGCDVCKDCVGGDGNFCDNCETCKMCSDFVCICGGGCSECVERICPECNEKCENCAADELCIDCGFCADCVGDGNFCFDCSLCITCVEMVCSCGGGCTNCAVVCMECCEKCSNCSDGELCTECGKCIDCAGSDSFCTTCGLCSDCGNVCPCGEGCENCADLCPDCGEVCSSCSDEFCVSCDLCRECAGDLFCEECYQCGDCTEVCEECGIVCRDCAESVCEDCGKCSGCIDEFCPDCGICIDCADSMCQDCYYCGDCAEICGDCGEYCSDCVGFCSECGKCESCIEICPDCELCTDCCAEIAQGYGCDHGICPESDEWKTHYCTAGEHCVGDSAKIEYNENEHWTLCGEGCDVKLNVQAHTFGEAEVTKQATKDADGVMKLSCTECGFSKEEKIPKLTDGHTHEYKSTVTEPSCLSGGYTTHTCSCGHSWKDAETAAVKHNYEHKYTEGEHWKECSFCHEATEKAPHKLGEWKTVLKAGYTFNGEKQRVCKICGYTVSESIPMLKVPEDKFVITMPDYSGGGEASIDKPDDETNENPQGTPPGKEPIPDTSHTVKELLTTGSGNAVPTLPVLAPKEEGYIFEGWVDKATGEPVKKGDKLTGNVELEPVWKNCPEDNHTDEDGDDICDECGYIFVKSEIPGGEDTTAADNQSNTNPTDGQDADRDGMPSWLIWLIVGCGGVVAACGSVLFVVLRKKKNEE